MKHNDTSLKSRFEEEVTYNNISIGSKSKNTIVMQLDDNETISLTSKSKNIQMMKVDTGTGNTTAIIIE